MQNRSIYHCGQFWKWFLSFKNGISKNWLKYKTGSFLFLALNILYLPTLKAQDSFYVSCLFGELYKCSLNSCTVQNIGSTNGEIMFDIAITPDGTLYGTTGQKLYKIDTLTAAIQYIGPLLDPSSGHYLNSLVALDNNTLIAAGYYDTLYRVNTANAQIQAIGVMGYGPAGDLTWYNGKLLLSEISNLLVEIEPTPGCWGIQNIRVIDTMNTPYSQVYGAITIGEKRCSQNTLRVVAFEGTDMYIIDPLNANATLTCPSMLNTQTVLCYVGGATSLSETMYQVSEPVIEIPNVFTPNGDGINDYFAPAVSGEWSDKKLSIYNRWGNEIRLPDNPSLSWDGSNDGEHCPDGTYFYRIVCKNVCDGEQVFSGFVQLIR